MTDQIHLAILVSGRGSNMEAIIRRCQSPYSPASIKAVISDQHDAPALDLARKRNIPEVRFIYHDSRQGFANVVDLVCQQHRIDLIVLAGFMRILDAAFVTRWDHRIVNIHPSLLPAYPGLRPHERVINDGTEVSGCTVHWVVPAVDAGPIIAQTAVPVMARDNAETLASRILREEHRLYYQSICAVCRELLLLRKDE